jgi:RsiW-degrading membrane proteinase PrsW (M82 family)
MTLTFIIAAILATSIPLVVLYIINRLDLYSTGDFRFVLFSFFWGGLAYLAAARINITMMDLGWITRTQMVQFTAPPIEEIIKSLILFYLIRRSKFTYFVDAAIYGFAIGIGFAIFENYEYLNGHSETALSIAIGRVMSTNLIHAACSATIGIGLGLVRFQHGMGKILYSLLSYIVAILFHLGFNNLVTRLNSALLLLYAAAVGFSGTLFIVALIKRGLKDEQRWIKEKLGMADRVTASEAAIVNRWKDAKDILGPLKLRFGTQKTAQIEIFLLAQARLGILRKSLDKIPDEKTRASVRKEMARVRQEMNQARKDVGTYCMIYVRDIFPENNNVLWGQLETAMETNQPTSPGGGMWASLEKQTQTTNQAEQQIPEEKQ